MKCECEDYNNHMFNIGSRYKIRFKNPPYSNHQKDMYFTYIGDFENGIRWAYYLFRVRHVDDTQNPICGIGIYHEHLDMFKIEKIDNSQ